MTEAQPKIDRSRGLKQVARSEWAALGAMGRTVLVALAMSAVVAVALAVFIPSQVERHLIEGEMRFLARIADDLADAELLSPEEGDIGALQSLDQAVRLNLLGSDTLRVKVWAPDGEITYSDVPALIGSNYPLSEDLIAAFNGETQVGIPDLTSPETVYEQDLPPLHEYYIPVSSDDGDIFAVFEVYRLRDHIVDTVGDVRAYVWLSVGIAIGLLGTFIAVLIVVNGRALIRRRRLTERLFSDLVRSQAEERQRIVGSLHDDIGQSLYRIHYGIEDMKSKGSADGSVPDGLVHLGTLVKEVDQVLRAELRLLQHESGEDLALKDALEELAEVTEMESEMAVSVECDITCELSPTGRSALFRAAREGVTNARKHAIASEVVISGHHGKGRIALEVRDNGIGFSDPEGLGLTTTRERLEAIGGGLAVKTHRRGGTSFLSWVPHRECDGDR